MYKSPGTHLIDAVLRPVSLQTETEGSVQLQLGVEEPTRTLSVSQAFISSIAHKGMYSLTQFESSLEHDERNNRMRNQSKFDENLTLFSKADDQKIKYETSVSKHN